jgi:metallophosphoesterase superfamily enzyme
VSGIASVAGSSSFATVKVASGVWLDSRLALWHESQRWLAVSDLHFGYELNRNRHGGLYPLWGMDTVEHRMRELIAHYQPARVILVGDVMDGSGSVDETLTLVERLSKVCELICIMGNHDSPVLRRKSGFVESHMEEGFYFHHGHRMAEMYGWLAPEERHCIHITGHLHPAYLFSDGAGLRLKMPAFMQARFDFPGDETATSPECWVLPAFSPWASGARVPKSNDGTQIYAVHRTRIMRVSEGPAWESESRSG